MHPIITREMLWGGRDSRLTPLRGPTACLSAGDLLAALGQKGYTCGLPNLGHVGRYTATRRLIRQAPCRPDVGSVNAAVIRVFKYVRRLREVNTGRCVRLSQCKEINSKHTTEE